MNILDPGHLYDLNLLDMKLNQAEAACIIRFVKREGDGYPGNKGHHAGTNIQEVLRACIDRCKYLHNQIPSSYTLRVIGHLQEAIYELECSRWRGR